MRLATEMVGLVSPRSTCESIGAETPERSARSRSERPIASRSARTLCPTSTIRPYVIAYERMSEIPVASESGPDELLQLIRPWRIRRVLQLGASARLLHDLGHVLLGDAEGREPQDV